MLRNITRFPFKRVSSPKNSTHSLTVQRFGSSSGGHHAHDEPHIPVFHARLGKSCLIATYLWIMYRIKEDKGQSFGLYQPWLHEHEHGPSLQYEEGEVDTVPTIATAEEEEEEDDHH